jgi:hypothetical protein
MVINHFNLVGVSFAPFEADTPLVVDADAELAGAIADKLLESVPRRDPKILKFVGCVYDQELTEGGALEFGGPATHQLTGKNSLSVEVPEALGQAK